MLIVPKNGQDFIDKNERKLDNLRKTTSGLKTFLDY